jgi:hypothetical protein
MENKKQPADSGRSVQVAYIRRNEDKEGDSTVDDEGTASLIGLLSYESRGSTADQEELVFDIASGKLTVSKSKNREAGSRNQVLTEMAASGYF